MTMKIINHKYLALYLIILCATLFMVFYRYIDYAYKAPSRLQDTSQESDMPPEMIEKAKKKNFLEHFLDLKNHFAFNSTYADYGSAKIRVLPIVIISTIFLYSNLKNHAIKYTIGRNNTYQRGKSKLKIKIALITPIFSLTIILVLLTIGLLSTDRNFSSPLFYFMYNHSDIISLFMINRIVCFVFFEVVIFVWLFLFNLLTLNLLDRYGKFDTLLIVIILAWLAPAVLLGNTFLEIIYQLLPGGVFLLGSLNGYTLAQLLMPILVLIIANIWIGKLSNDKLEI